MILDYEKDVSKNKIVDTTIMELRTSNKPWWMVRSLNNLLKTLHPNTDFNLTNKVKGNATDSANQIICILGHILNLKTLPICSDILMENIFTVHQNPADPPSLTPSLSEQENFWIRVRKAVNVWELSLKENPPSHKRYRKRKSNLSSKGTDTNPKAPKQIKRLFIKIEETGKRI